MPKEFDPDIKFPLCGIQYEKMREYAIWYSGEPDLLATYYILFNTHNIFNTRYQVNANSFWSKQAREETITAPVHIPMAADIAELSSDLLFGESPTIRLAEAFKEEPEEVMVQSQEDLETLLDDSGFMQKLTEAAETSAAVGGVFVKLAISHTMADYPIPVVEQPDNAIFTFKFGKLFEVTFINVVRSVVPSKTNATREQVYRLLETYTINGEIIYNLHLGTSQKLGTEIDMEFLKETEDLEDFETGYNGILAQYIPNMLPNRIERDSSIGRSDYQGLESLMHSLDEAYSAWMRDIALSKAKLLVPSTYLENVVGEDSTQKVLRFDQERAIYAKMNVDPLNKNFKIEAVQFAIRAEDFEKTCLDLMERIASGAGYSPQSFGLNIEGRVESGEALNIRERKSYSKKSKKEKYWKAPIKNLIDGMIYLYNDEFDGDIGESDITVAFATGITHDINETSSAVDKIRKAKAASTKTLVKMLHPDWSNKQVETEVEAIIEEERRVVEDPLLNEEFSKFKESLNNEDQNNKE